MSTDMKWIIGTGVAVMASVVGSVVFERTCVPRTRPWTGCATTCARTTHGSMPDSMPSKSRSEKSTRDRAGCEALAYLLKASEDLAKAFAEFMCRTGIAAFEPGRIAAEE